MTALARFLNGLDDQLASRELGRCCGAKRWVEAMLGERPFADDKAVLATAKKIWQQLDPDDWLEAFAHHPRIGERAVRQDLQTARAWSEQEQAGVTQANSELAAALVAGNRRYEERFGHVFLTRAAGRSGEDMLAELERRLANDPQVELRVAAGQQLEITQLRLQKLIGES